MRIAMLTDSKKALMFAGAIVFGVIMTVDSHSGETAFDATDPDYEYQPAARDVRENDRSERLFGESERDDVDDGGDVDVADTEGFDPTPEDVTPTSPLMDGETRPGSMNIANRPPGIDGPGT